jgi:hypothetical protein
MKEKMNQFVDDATPDLSPYSSPDGGTSTAVLERPQIDEGEQLDLDDSGDQDRFAHYVSKKKIMQSKLTGRAVVALCGKVWVPKHNPEDYPICPECKRIFDQMQADK